MQKNEIIRKENFIKKLNASVVAIIMILTTLTTMIGFFAVPAAADETIQLWQWAVNPTGPSTMDKGKRVAVDTNGNVYVTGSITHSATFGSTTLTSYGTDDILIAKLDAEGTWLWAQHAGGMSHDCGNDVVVDADGNVYITGYFSDTATFGDTTLTANASDLFVAKLSTNGVWQWAESATTIGDFIFDGNGIAVDNDGSAVVTGFFLGTVLFGDTDIELTSNGDWDIFVAKISADGVWQWAENAGGSGRDVGSDIVLDGFGNAYVIGHFFQTSLFGDYELTSEGYSDVFVAKIDSTGVWQWAERAGGTSWDYGYGIAGDASGNTYITGEFQETASFGSTVLTSAEDMDVFVAKLSNDGIWQWAERAGGTDSDSGHDVALDADGDVYITGRFVSTDAEFGVTTLSSEGGADLFVAKLSNEGVWQWAEQAGGPEYYDHGYGIAVDHNGGIYITGIFLDSITFGDITLTGSHNDLFLAKLKQEHIPLELSYATFTNPCVAPNWYNQGVKDYAIMEVGWTSAHPVFVNITVHGIGTFSDDEPNDNISIFQIPITGIPDGNYNISYKITDSFGNISTTVNGTNHEPLRLDNTKSTVEVIYGEPNIAFNGFIMIGAGTPVTLRATDPGYPETGIGVCTLWVSAEGPTNLYPIQDGDPEDESNEPGVVQVSFTFDEDCWHEIDYRAMDCLGNYYPSETGFMGEDFYVDATPPTTNTEIVGPNFPIAGTSYSWFGPCTTKWLNVTDDGCQGGAGVKELRINVYKSSSGPQGPWETVANYIIPDGGFDGDFHDVSGVEGVISVPFHFDEDCWHLIEHYGVDYVGNEEAISTQTGTKQVHRIDATAPESSLEIDTCWFEGDLGIYVSLNAIIEMIIDNVGVEPCIYPEVMGFFRVYVEAEDQWYPDENGEGSYYNYNIDDVDFWKDTYWYKYNVEEKFKFTEECNHTFEFFSKDPLCNTEDTHIIDFFVDVTAPETWLYVSGHGYYQKNNIDYLRAGKHFSLNASDETDGCVSGIESIFFRYEWNDTFYPEQIGD
ncbi:MAG: SBBP repeat-containing protein, partial [Thermoplasmatota archaeon]